MNYDRNLLRLARGSRLSLLLTVGIGFLTGLLTVLQARVLSQVISRVFLDGQGLAAVARLLGVLLWVAGLRAVLLWAGEVSANAVAVHVKTELRQALFRKLISLGPAYTRGERTGELTSVAVEGIEALDAYFSQYLPQVVLAALVPLTFLLFILPLDPLTGIVLLVTAPLIPLFMILIGNLAQSMTRQQWRTLSRMSAYFLDVLQGLTTLKLLGRSRAQVGVIGQVSENFRQATMNVLRVTFLSALVLEMVSTLSVAVVAVEIGLRLLAGRLVFEQAFFVLLLAPEFYLPVRMLGARFHAGMSGVAAARRIFEILEQPEPEAGREEALPVAENLPETGAEKGIGVTFQSVRFAYGEDRPALQGVSFHIPAGHKVALVGPSGAGKSTIASLLLGFLRPSGGQINITGLPAGRAEGQGDAWRQLVAWVPQHPYLFHDTAAANIRLARPEATRDEVEQAARLAHADSFIRELPQGYDTVIGERGARLSGGQAQRIALARAFLKDAPLLILDEPTANLDPESEASLQEAMDRLLVGRTGLIIAHRLNTVAAADRILVLDEGRLVESGRHEALLSGEGLYRRLVTAYGQRGDGGVAGGQDLRSRRQPDLPPLSPPPPALFTAGEQPVEPLETVHRGAFRIFRRLLGFVAPLRSLVALAALLGFATVGSAIGLMTTSAYIIASAALQPSIAELQVAIVGVRFFGIARGLFRYLERYVSHEVTFRLLARLRVWMYEALEPLAPARLMDYRSGDLLSRLIADIEALENFYVRVLAPPLVALLTAVVVSVFLAGFAPELAAALLFFLFLAGVVVPLLIRRLSRTAGRGLVAARAALSAALVDGIQGLADLLAFNREEAQLEVVAGISRKLGAAQRRMANVTGLQAGLESLLANLGMLSVLVFSIPLVVRGEITGVTLAVLTLAALTSFEAVQPLPLAFQHLEANLAAGRRLFEIADAAPAVRDPAQPLPLSASEPNGRTGTGLSLEVKNLSFCYPVSAGADPEVPQPCALQDISFSLPAGKRAAIVGPSGSGKTTLVNLLLRFWNFEEGQILLAGEDIRDFRQDELRRVLGIVSQNTYLFNASVFENLLLARPNATREEIVAAAELAQIHSFIETLPDGYDTFIGEQGLRLSGGERQRLAIARVLLKDSPLLVLDEATANLDALTERSVLDSIYRLQKGRTILTITHRLAGLECMDEILVLRQGRIVERGRHDELLAQNGFYRRMWALQHRLLGDKIVS